MVRLGQLRTGNGSRVTMLVPLSDTLSGRTATWTARRHDQRAARGGTRACPLADPVPTQDRNSQAVRMAKKSGRVMERPVAEPGTAQHLAGVSAIDADGGSGALTATAAAAAAAASALASAEPVDAQVSVTVGQPAVLNVTSLQMRTVHPVELVWKDITLDVSVPGRCCRPGSTKRILNGVSGFTRPGEMLAIMGSTGAGKTSLLNVLARRSEGVAHGTVLVNGKPPGHDFKFAGYVAQDDTGYATLTVRETLTLAALLRLPRTMSQQEKMARVESVIAELGLEKCADTRVGSPNTDNRGLSGGERRRLSIGEVLITDPGLLFLDEPTSGLDAATSLSVMETLRTLAQHGRTIVCTIHQPRSNIFTKFDRLMLLAQGRCVYFGEASRAIDYFASLAPTAFVCPPFTNPADFFCVSQGGVPSRPTGSVDLITVVGRDDKLAASDRIQYLIDSYKEPPIASLTPAPASAPARAPDAAPGPSGPHPTAWPYQLYLLTQRSFRNVIREPMTTFVRLFQNVLMAVLTGLIFLRLGYGQTSVQDRVGVLFFCCTFMGFNGITSVITVFPTEKPIVRRERLAGAYKVSAYFLGKNLAELPLDVFFALVYVSITYWMVGLNPLFERYIVLAVVMLLLGMASVSLGQLVSAASPTATIASIIAPISMVFTMLFAGFFINASSTISLSAGFAPAQAATRVGLDLLIAEWNSILIVAVDAAVAIPPWFIWAKYLSFMKYAFEALIVNEFSGVTFTCSAAEQLPGGLCPVPDGARVIANLGAGGVNIAVNCAIIAGLIVGFRLLAYIALRVTTRPTTRGALPLPHNGPTAAPGAVIGALASL